MHGLSALSGHSFRLGELHIFFLLGVDLLLSWLKAVAIHAFLKYWRLCERSFLRNWFFLSQVFPSCHDGSLQAAFTVYVDFNLGSLSVADCSPSRILGYLMVESPSRQLRIARDPCQGSFTPNKSRY